MDSRDSAIGAKRPEELCGQQRGVIRRAAPFSIRLQFVESLTVLGRPRRSLAARYKRGSSSAIFSDCRRFTSL